MRIATIPAAVAMAFSAGAFAAPTVYFKTPTSGKTLSGSISGTSCAVTGSRISRVVFYLDSTQLNTDGNASNGLNCQLDTTKFSNGSHVIRAVAYDSGGATQSAQVSVTIQNGTSTPPPASSTAPTLSFQMPAEGGALSGNVQGPPNCTVTGDNLAKVEFFLNGTLTNTDGNLSNGLGCWIDTTKYANGSYTLKATGYNSAGASVSATRAIQIQNGSSTPTNKAPTVSLTAPAAGATLSGTVNGTGCVASASDDKAVARVEFALGTTALASDASSPYQCLIDTTKFANGSYNLMAKAVDADGASATATRTVSVQNSTSTPPPTGGAIDAADIIGKAPQALPFTQHSGYSTQVIGQYVSAPSIPESGIHGSTLSNGETLRLGKATDPVNSVRKALAFQLSPNDPSTSGSKRAEISFGQNIEMNKVYWTAFSVFVNDWGTLSSSDAGLFGTQLHSGDNSRGLSPSFGLYTAGNGRNFQVHARHSTSSSPSPSNSVTAKYAERPIPFGRWVDFVFKFRQSTSGGGYLQVWQDGAQIVNHQGNLGFNTPGYKDYMKFGYYNWSSAFSSTRKVLVRSPVIVADPTGSKYKPEDLRAYVNAQ
jgi:hypothetical protein